MSRRPNEVFARELEAAGLVVRRKPTGECVVLSPAGKVLGAFGRNVEHGRTKANIIGQVKRETGIVVESGRVRRPGGRPG